VRAPTFDPEHGNAGAGRHRAIASRGGEADVVEDAVVTAHDDERFVCHSARPFEDTVDEAWVTGRGDGDERSGGECDARENKSGPLHGGTSGGAPPASGMPRLDLVGEIFPYTGLRGFDDGVPSPLSHGQEVLYINPTAPSAPCHPGRHS